MALQPGTHDGYTNTCYTSDLRTMYMVVKGDDIDKLAGRAQADTDVSPCKQRGERGLTYTDALPRQ